VKRQRKFPEPFAHYIKETARVALMPEADGQVVCATIDDHAASSFPPSPALSPIFHAGSHGDSHGDSHARPQP
jgi:hypothetical protein